MNKDKYVFAQLIGFLDNNKFRHLVDKYDGNRYVKHFTCWNRAYVPLYDGRALRLHAVEEVVGRHLPPAPPQRAPLAVGRLRTCPPPFLTYLTFVPSSVHISTGFCKPKRFTW